MRSALYWMVCSKNWTVPNVHASNVACVPTEACVNQAFVGKESARILSDEVPKWIAGSHGSKTRLL